MTNVCSLFIALGMLALAATLAVNGSDKVTFVTPPPAAAAAHA